MPKRVMLTEQEDRARQVLELFKDLRRLSDAEIAARSGFPNHQYVQARRAGATKIDWTDVVKLSEAFELPTDVFRLDPIDAEQWDLDRRREHADYTGVIPIRSMTLVNPQPVHMLSTIIGLRDAA